MGIDRNSPVGRVFNFVKKIGDTMRGFLTFENTFGVRGKKTDDTIHQLIIINNSDQAEIGSDLIEILVKSNAQGTTFEKTTKTEGDFLLLTNNRALQGRESNGTIRDLIKENNFNNTEVGNTANLLFLSASATPTFTDGTNLFELFHEGFTLPNARITNSLDQSIPDNTNTVVEFDTSRWDTDSIVDLANNQFEIQTGGFYAISFNGRWETNATGTRIVSIRLNGSTLIGIQGDETNTAGQQMRQEVTTIYQLQATDTLEVVVFQDSGVALNLESGAEVSPEFSVSFLSPL